MRMQMVDRHQRFAKGHAQGLGGNEPNQQRPGQARRVGHRNGGQVGQTHLSAAQSLIHHRQDALDVRARGKLRYDPSILLMQLLLRRDDRGEDL